MPVLHELLSRHCYIKIPSSHEAVFLARLNRRSKSSLLSSIKDGTGISFILATFSLCA